MSKRKLFISFRYSDGKEIKEELQEILNDYIIDKSEDEERSGQSEDTIQKYLYNKLKDTSVTLVVLTPEAVNYRKDMFGNYDDWLYDELRYSLQDRSENKTNAVVAIYTKDTKAIIMRESSHYCEICKETSNINTIMNFDNLVSKNIHNVLKRYKCNPCEGVYSQLSDSYISLVSLEEFSTKPEYYINNAIEKRDEKYKFDLRKVM